MYFSHKTHHGLLMLRNFRQHFSLALGKDLTSEITNKKFKSVKNMSLNRPSKGHIYTKSAETKRQVNALFYLSWGRVCQTTQNFHHSAHVHE